MHIMIKKITLNKCYCSYTHIVDQGSAVRFSEYLQSQTGQSWHKVNIVNHNHKTCG